VSETGDRLRLRLGLLLQEPLADSEEEMDVVGVRVRVRVGGDTLPLPDAEDVSTLSDQLEQVADKERVDVRVDVCSGVDVPEGENEAVDRVMVELRLSVVVYDADREGRQEEESLLVALLVKLQERVGGERVCERVPVGDPDCEPQDRDLVDVGWGVRLAVLV